MKCLFGNTINGICLNTFESDTKTMSVFISSHLLKFVLKAFHSSMAHAFHYDYVIIYMAQVFKFVLVKLQICKKKKNIHK